MNLHKLLNSPLREIVFVVQFEGANFSSVHWGMYWQNIKGKFPDYLDVPPINQNDYPSSLPPLRGAFFIAENKTRIIQLQEGAFIYQCRELDSDTTLDFEPLLQEFLEQWQQFKQWWLSLSPISIYPVTYRLVYNNVIDHNSGWYSPKDNPKIFTFISESNSWENSIETLGMFDCNLYFDLPQSLGFLRVEIDQREKDDDEESDFLLFSLLATKQRDDDEENTNDEIFDSNEGLEIWFKLAHENIVKYFFDLTGKTVQKIWRGDNEL